MTCLEAIAKVDHGYFLLGKINEKLSTNKTPIDQMIDNACRYDETRKMRKLAIATIKGIIEGKKALGVDYSKDVAMLDELKRMEEAK